ncbi:AAA family ATPase [Streptomyces sp. NPDC054786]
MQLVERAGALAGLQGFLAESADKRGQVVLVTGGIATGKTRLLNGFAEQASEAGTLVLTATALRAEQNLRLGVIDQLLRGAVLPSDAAASLHPMASWLDETDAGDSASPPHDARRRIVTALLDLAQQHRLVLLVDDVQFADEESLQVLLHLQLRIRSAGVMLVYTECAQHWPRQSWFRGELVSRPHHRLQLCLLSEAGVARLAAEQLGATEAAAAAPELYALTGGNPLLLGAELEDRRAEALTQPGEQPLPCGAFRQAFLACLRRCDPAVSDIAHALAVLGDAATPALATELTGLGPQAAADCLHVLHTAGLIAEGRFRHPEAARTIIESLCAEDRSALHVRAAQLLYTRGAAALDVARHLVVAQDTSLDWAVGTLRAAAEEAVIADEPELGVRCLSLVLDTCPNEEVRVAVLTMLARLEWRTNPAVAALHLAALDTALHNGTLPAAEAAGVARQLLWQGSPGASVASARAADDADGPGWARVRLTHTLVFGSARHLSAAYGEPSAGELTAVCGDPWTRAGATLIASMGTTESEKQRVAESAEHLLHSWRLKDDTLEVGIAAVMALVHTEKLDRAAVWCETLRREAERRRARTWQALFGSVRAEISRRQGDVLIAAQCASEALDLLHTQGWGVAVGLPLSTLLLARTAMGMTEPTDQIRMLCVPEAMFHSVFGLRYLHARGHQHLAAGRILAAASDFQRSGDLMRKWKVDLPALVPWRSDLALAHVHMGQNETARKLLAEQLTRPGADRAHVRGTTLRVLAAAGEPQKRPGLLRQAVDTLHLAGDRFAMTTALAELSQAWHGLGEYRRARTASRQAVEEAKACNAEQFLPRRSGGSSDGAQHDPAQAEADQALSDAERRVANLAAMGLTNREISRRLYITVSTVEQHLTRVYKKLAIRGRVNLPTGLTRHEFQPTS